jgi:glycosyltransferase involved in cell wall biosynthesis
MENKRIQRKKLTIILNTLQSFGGGERWALEAAVRLKKNFDITLVNPISRNDIVRISKQELLKTYDLRGVDIVDVECYGVNTKLKNTGKFTMRMPKPKELSKLKNAIVNADIVYDITLNPVLISYSLLLARVYKKRFILGMHNPEFLMEKQGGDSGPVLNMVQKFLLKRVKEIHALTETQVHLLHKLNYKGRVHHIPHFLYFEPAKPSATTNRDGFVCLFVGRLAVLQKGVDLLEVIIGKTLKKSKQIKFRIIGSQDDGEAVVKRLERKYHGNVSWRGFVSDSSLKNEYKKANLFILPSRYETTGLSLLEAQSYGMPAVAFNVSGPNEIIKTSAQGALVKPFDVDAFSEAILESFRSHEKDGKAYLRRKLKIYKLIKSRYSEKKFISKFTDMLNQ